MYLVYYSIKLLTKNTPLWCCRDFTLKRSDTDPNLFWTFCSNKRGRLVRRPWKGRHISNQYIFTYLSHSLISFLKTCRFWQVHRYRLVQRYPFQNILSLVKMILYYDIISKCQGTEFQLRTMHTTLFMFTKWDYFFSLKSNVMATDALREKSRA